MKKLILLVFMICAFDAMAGNLRLIMYKVFHGDMMLLTLPSGKQMVIDAGYPGKAKKFLFPTLAKEGITKIDYLVITHNDIDHMGGAAEIIENYEVGVIWHNGRPKDSKAFRRYRAAAKRRGVPLKRMTAGEMLTTTPNTFYMDNGTVKFEILNPFDKSVYNSESMVFKLTWKNFTMLFTSDLQRAGQRAVLKKFKPLLKSRVYKVLHHGGGSVKGWLKAVHPEVSLCPCLTIPPWIPFIYPSPWEIIKLRIMSDYYSVRTKSNIQLITDGDKIKVSKYKLYDE